MTFREYLGRESDDGVYVLNHVATKINIDNNTCAVCLFTSQKTSDIPGAGNTKNVYIGGKLFKYANPVIFFDNTNFSRYCTVSDNFNDFPIFARQSGLGIRGVVENALCGFKKSYDESYQVNNLFARAGYADLVFQRYTDEAAHFAYSLGMVNRTQYELVTKFSYSSEAIEAFEKKMNIGFNGEDIMRYKDRIYEFY